MALRDQLERLKKNWLLLLVGILFVFFVSLDDTSPIKGNVFNQLDASGEILGTQSARYDDNTGSNPVERKVVTTFDLVIQTKHKDFVEATAQVNDILSQNQGLVLEQRENTYGSGRKTIHGAMYTIKVPTVQADRLISLLKQIGEVQSFSQHQSDITTAYQRTEIELSVEKQRLLRYELMFKEAATISEKIDLNDRIFDQERKIQYLEDALKNQELTVEYATLYLQLQEQSPASINLVFVTFSELIHRVVQSANTLLQFFAWILPYAVVSLAVWMIVRKVKSRK